MDDRTCIFTAGYKVYEEYFFSVKVLFFHREVYTQISMFATAADLSVSVSSFNELPTTANFQAELTFEGHGVFCFVARAIL